MEKTFLGFLNNAALLLALGVIYSVIQRRSETPGKKIFSGILLGITAVAVMLNPWELQPGIIFDTRPIVLCVGGMFLGAIPTLIAAALATLFRLHIGGIGAMTGSLWVITSSAWGLCWLFFRKRPAWKIASGEYYLLGLSLSAALLLQMFTMPSDMAVSILKKITLPVLTIFPIATVLLARLFATYDIHLQHHRRIEENERKYKQLVEEANFPILQVDMDGRILFINDFGLEFFDIPLDALIGRNLIGTILPESARDEYQQQAAIARAGGTSSAELELEHACNQNRLCTIEWKLAPFSPVDGKPAGIQLIGHDTTEKKVRQAQVIRTAQLASLGELSAGVAHEINNPVSGVINYAIMLKAQVEDDRQQVILDKIMREGERIAKTVRNLLAFSRDDKEEFGVHDFSELIADALALNHAQLNQDGIAVDITLPETTQSVCCNAHQIEQILLNFFSNARYTLNRKYPNASERKRIDITVLNENNDRVSLAFTDYGEGIPEEVRSRIFSPFFTTKEPGVGTGLGLSICHEIIDLHDGTIDVESEAGAYTTFRINLPSQPQPQVNTSS